LAKRPYARYWIAGSDYEYGHAVANGLWQNLQKIKPDVQLLGESWWKLGEPDFMPYITAILPAKPDCLIVATGGRDCVPFLKTAKSSDLNDKLQLFMHTAGDSGRALGLEAPEGVITTDNYYPYYPDSPQNKEFVKEFTERYKREPNQGALYGYLAAHFLQKAYEKAGKIDTEKLIDSLEGLTVSSPVGDTTIRAFDHQVVLPMFMGVTKKEPGFNYLVASDITLIPGEDLMPSIEEIKKAREKQ
jgi:branched-chain amino acid transport system substrate-binding protein